MPNARDSNSKQDSNNNSIKPTGPKKREEIALVIEASEDKEGDQDANETAKLGDS